jgi:hypothetical protein
MILENLPPQVFFIFNLYYIFKYAQGERDF